MRNVTCVFLSCLTIMSCGGDAYQRRVRGLASAEFSCPAEQISVAPVAELGSGLYSARGCNKEQQYACAPLTGGGFNCGVMDRTGPPVDPPPNPTGTGGGSGDPPPGRENAPHDHVESCWIDKAGISNEDQVDMMLFVVGLNHQSGACIKCGVDIAGTRALAKAIYQAWPNHPESIVIASSSFRAPCEVQCVNDIDAPAPPEALIQALQELYGSSHTFTLREYLANPNDSHWGTQGVTVGSRWTLGDGQHRKYTSGMAEIWLSDTKSRVALPIFVYHNEDFNHTNSVSDIRSAAQTAASEIHQENTAVPIIAGDPNFNEDGLEDDLQQALHANFTWANENVACSGVRGLPDGIFQTQNGNVIQAFTGQIHASDPSLAIQCARAELRPVRLSYSVDAAGNLAARPDLPAEKGGIILDDIAHNVLAIGMKIERRTDKAPASCQRQDCLSLTQSQCGQSPDWCKVCKDKCPPHTFIGCVEKNVMCNGPVTCPP